MRTRNRRGKGGNRGCRRDLFGDFAHQAIGSLDLNIPHAQRWPPSRDQHHAAAAARPRQNADEQEIDAKPKQDNDGTKLEERSRSHANTVHDQSRAEVAPQRQGREACVGRHLWVANLAGGAKQATSGDGNLTFPQDTSQDLQLRVHDEAARGRVQLDLDPLTMRQDKTREHVRKACQKKPTRNRHNGEQPARAWRGKPLPLHLDGGDGARLRARSRGP